MKNIILDSGDIKNKINRISFEIIEKNFDKDEILMVGYFQMENIYPNK